MTNFRCNACQGTFSSPDAEGYDYYHACPEFRMIPAQAPQAPDILVPIPGRRNENIRISPEGKVVGIMAHGMGVTVL